MASVKWWILALAVACALLQAQKIPQDVFNEGFRGGQLDVGGPVGGFLGQMEPGAGTGYGIPGVDYGGPGIYGGNILGGGALTNLGPYGPGFMSGQLGGLVGGGADLGAATDIDGRRFRKEEREDRRQWRKEERERRRQERRWLREERRRQRQERRRLRKEANLR
ncbi:uncharacterized protein [Dermacentor andersoni]|uniref:uncharacterized protein isoform X2 n=1 Tax=Dermacentor andersoni TaxID=34620 RepID=UPI003B3A35CE